MEEIEGGAFGIRMFLEEQNLLASSSKFFLIKQLENSGYISLRPKNSSRPTRASVPLKAPNEESRPQLGQKAKKHFQMFPAPRPRSPVSLQGRLKKTGWEEREARN